MRACLLLIAVSVVAAENPGVEGRAFNRVTQVGVAGVKIQLALATDTEKQLYTATSDANGAFRVADVKEGYYVATFSDPDGFIAPNRWEPPCKPFRVDGQGKPANLQVPMIPLAQLRGRVLDRDGNPVPNVQVELFRVHYQGGSFETTDSQGRFVHKSLISGPYQMRARPVLDGSVLSRRLKVVSKLPEKPPEDEHWGWVPTYYPNAVEMDAAETIVVREGADLDGYDIRLRATPVYRLRGTVVDDAGKPAGGVSLYLLSEIGWGAAESVVKSGADGVFEFPSVRQGQWSISAERKLDSVTWKGSAEILMPNHDAQDVRVQVDPPFSLVGATEGVPAGSRLYAYLDPVVRGEESMGAKGSGDGFLFEAVYPGRYQLGVFGEVPGYYLQSIFLGNDDITGKVLSLTPTSRPFRLVFRANSASVEGSVEDGAGVRVVLIEANQERAIDGQSLKAITCDSGGRFHLENLRPGTYYAVALKIVNVESGAIEDAVFRRGLARQATTVELREGQQVSVKLRVVSTPDM